MAQYLVVLRFNSYQNAYNFVQNSNNQPLTPEILTVPPSSFSQTYVTAPPGIGSPGSSPVPPQQSTYVAISVTSLYNLPNMDMPLIFNEDTRQVIAMAPYFDPNTLTLKSGDNTIFSPTSPVSPVSPIDYQPVYPPDNPLRELKFVVPPDSNTVPPDQSIIQPWGPQPEVPYLPPGPDITAPFEDWRQQQQQIDAQPQSPFLDQNIDTTPKIVIPPFTPDQPDIITPPLGPLRRDVNLVYPPGFDQGIDPQDLPLLKYYQPWEQTSPPDLMDVPIPPPDMTVPPVPPIPPGFDPRVIPSSYTPGEGGGVPMTTGPVWFATIATGMLAATQRVFVYRSTNGYNWSSIELTGYFNFVVNSIVNPVNFFQFRNGFGIMKSTSSQNSQVTYSLLSSANAGLTWELVFRTSPGDGKSIADPVFDVAGNQWTAQIVGGSLIKVPVPWASGKYANSQDGDNVGNIPTGSAGTVILVSNPDSATNTLLTSANVSDPGVVTLKITSAAGDLSIWDTVYQEFNPLLAI